jgi:hypothetical protein
MVEPIDHAMRQGDEIAALPVWAVIGLAAFGQRCFDCGERFGRNRDCDHPPSMGAAGEQV